MTKYGHSARTDPDRRGLWLLVAETLVLGAWVGAWVTRTAYASPNVDDYLYTSTALTIWLPARQGHLVSALKAVFHTGQNAPLIPTLAAPLSAQGPDVAVVVQLALLLLLTFFVFRLVSSFAGAAFGCAAAVTTSLLPSALGWSVMVHMALATATFSIGALVFALESKGFSNRRPSIAFGLALGLLAVSRSMAPIFVSAVLGSVALTTVVCHTHPFARVRLINAMLAAGCSLVIAGPWWLLNGSRALSYLVSAGYATSSGMVRTGNPITNQLTWTANDWGIVTVVGLGGVLLASIIAGVHGRRTHAKVGIKPQKEALSLFTLFGVFVLGTLSTSNDSGTAFALPALAAFASAAAVAAARGRATRRLYLGVGALLSLGSVLAISVGLPVLHMIPGAPYAGMASQALGGDVPPDIRASQLNRALIDQVMGGSIFVTRDDDLVNPNGLVYEKALRGVGGAVGSPPYDPAKLVVKPRRGFSYVLTGTSCYPYHRNVDEAALENYLHENAYELKWQRVLSPCNRLLLWHLKGPA